MLKGSSDWTIKAITNDNFLKAAQAQEKLNRLARDRPHDKIRLLERDKTKSSNQ